MCVTHLKIYISQHYNLFMAKVEKMDKWVTEIDWMNNNSV